MQLVYFTYKYTFIYKLPFCLHVNYNSLRLSSWYLQSVLGILAFTKWRMLASMHVNASACPLNFWVFDCLVKAKEATKNYRFNIFAYEVHDPWHTRYQLASLNLLVFEIPFPGQSSFSLKLIFFAILFDVKVITQFCLFIPYSNFLII
jgi:hypothetical protein